MCPRGVEAGAVPFRKSTVCLVPLFPCSHCKNPHNAPRFGGASCSLFLKLSIMILWNCHLCTVSFPVILLLNKEPLLSFLSMPFYGRDTAITFGISQKGSGSRSRNNVQKGRISMKTRKVSLLCRIHYISITQIWQGYSIHLTSWIFLGLSPI